MSDVSRRKPGSARSDDAPGGESRLVASGTVQAPGESDALDVELTIDDFEVTMRAGRAEIGTWLASMVTIRRLDDVSFEFIAEGDRLIFVPDGPHTFGRHPSIVQPESEKETKRRKKEASREAKQAAKQEAEEVKQAAKQEADEAKQAAKQGAAEARAAQKAARREAKRRESDTAATERRARDEAEPSLEASPLSPLEERIAVAEAAIAGPGAEPEPFGEPMPITELADDDEGAEDEPDDGPNRLWIRAIDIARRYDLLGLDRVPIDESLRGQEHVHTWEHRVAVSSGAGAHICTICGKIRR